MFTHDLLSQLICPYCSSEFQLEAESSTEGHAILFGILRCACYRYPIIDGIAFLRQRSAAADTIDEGVRYIEKRDFDGSLRHALNCTSPIPRTRSRWQKAKDFLASRLCLFSNGKVRPTGFHEALKIHRPRGYADYLFYRHANESFLAAVPLLLLLNKLAEGPPGQSRQVLDLNCGVGHASFLIQTLFPHLSVIATDHDFVNLHFVKHYIAPQATCLCVDAELPLPFKDASFDAMLCMDGIHYIRSKVALLKELNRCARDESLWLFPHMHNALAKNISAGIPLGPEDYQRCFDFIPSRLLIESDVLDGFIREQRLDLTALPGPDRIRNAHVFSLVASHRPDIWRRHDNMGPVLTQNKSHLAVNPIYQSVGQSHDVHLRMQWPSERLETECQKIQEYLPRQCDIGTSLWNRLNAGNLTTPDYPVVEKLMQTFVLVHLPELYV